MSTTATNLQETIDPFANKRSTGRKNQPNTRRPPHPSNPNQGFSRKQNKPSSNSGTKNSAPHGALDFIDTLDTIGGFHHDGPFDAASSHRNRHLNSKNPSRQAPMAAFDPSALILPPPPSAPAPTMVPTQDHIYPPVIPRRCSESTMPVSMGYPAGTIAADPKAARLAEAFGIQGKEAWEDFGMEYAVEGNSEGREGGPQGHRRGISREERDAKSASVWDMEETLKSGRPVPSAPPPRPKPESTPRGSSGEPDRPASNSAQLKRSKSLMQRIKKGVKSPNLPMELPTPPLSAEPLEDECEELRTEPQNAPQISPPLGRKASLLVKFGLVRRSNTKG